MPTAREDGRAAGDRFAQPLLDALGRPGVDQRPDVGRLVERIAGLERFRAACELAREVVVQRRVDVHTLHGDARLARVAEAAENDSLERVVDVGVLVHDHGRVAAELERDALAPGTRLQAPADRRAAGEREQLDPVVIDERPSRLGRARQHRDRVLRPARLEQDPAELERAARCLRRRP